MSVKLSNRLDKIENEIRSMLMLQKYGSGNDLTVTETTPEHAGNENEPKQKQLLSKINSKRLLKMPPSHYTFPICLQKSKTKIQRSTIKLAPAKCTSEIARPVTDPYKPSKSNLACCCVSTIIGKPKPKPVFGSCPAECRTMCRCGISPLMELEIEQAKRRRLEEEVSQLKSQICSLNQSKNMAVTMTKQLKRKYEKIRNSFDESSTKLQTITKENSLLCKCLQQERQRNVVRAKGDTASQKCDDTCVCKGRGLETVQEKDEQIRSLNESVMTLTKSVHEKEQEKKKLEQEKTKLDQEKQKVEQKLQQHKDVTKKLSETNSKLSKSVKSKHESFMALKNKTGRYEKQLDDYKSSLRRSQQEIEQLKRDVDKEKKEKAAAAKAFEKHLSTEDLSEKLKKTKDRERKSSEVIQVLSQKLRDAEEKQNKEAEREINRLRTECKNLQGKLDEANQKLKDCHVAEAKKIETLKKEMANVSQNLSKNSEARSEDKGKLNAMIAELQTSLEEQEMNLAALEEFRQQQDLVIKSLNEQLISKDEEIRLQEQENAIMREKVMDNTVEQMQSSGDMTEDQAPVFDCGIRITDLEARIEELLPALDMEKQRVVELEKIIEDQNQQLDTLRTAQAELKKTEEKLIRTERELEKQQELTQETALKIEKMQTTKVRLERKMDNLETMCVQLLETRNESLNRVMALEGQLEEEKVIRVELCQKLEDEENQANRNQSLSHVVALEEQLEEEQAIRVELCQKLEDQKNQVIENQSLNRVMALEGQLEDEKAIRVELCQKLEDEKNRAIDVAKFARRTLIETVEDYQGHMMSQMHVQRVIYDIMKTKMRKKRPGCLHNRGKDTAQHMEVPGVAGSVDGFTTTSSRGTPSLAASKRPDSAPVARPRDQTLELKRQASFQASSQGYANPGTEPMALSDEDSRRQHSSSTEYATAAEDLSHLGYQMRACCEMGIPMPPMVQESFPYLLSGYSYGNMLPPCAVAIPCRCINHSCECDYGNICQPNRPQTPPQYPMSQYNPFLSPSIQYATPVNNQMMPPFPQFAVQKQQVSTKQQTAERLRTGERVQFTTGPRHQVCSGTESRKGVKQQASKVSPKKSSCACSNKKKGSK